jgi:hypothetical protein
VHYGPRVSKTYCKTRAVSAKAEYLRCAGAQFKNLKLSSQATNCDEFHSVRRQGKHAVKHNGHCALRYSGPIDDKQSRFAAAVPSDNRESAFYDFKRSAPRLIRRSGEYGRHSSLIIYDVDQPR